MGERDEMLKASAQLLDGRWRLIHEEYDYTAKNPLRKWQFDGVLADAGLAHLDDCGQAYDLTRLGHVLRELADG